MLIIISKNRANDLFEKDKNNKNILFLDKVCHLKNIKDKDNILIIDCDLLNDNGIIKYYHYHIEEVLITIPINKVLAFNINDKIKEICDFHNKKLINI